MRVLVAAASFLACLSFVQAQPFSLAKYPIFSRGSEAHGSTVLRIQATADERFIVSGSYDRSIRIWNAETGELVRRLQLPLASFGDGGIMAIALSPDSRRAAVGGWISAFGGRRAVAIVSLEDGSIEKALTGFADNTRSLAWSPDGKHLVVGIGGPETPGHAIEVYDTASWSKVFEDRDLGAQVGQIAHRADGRFAVSAHGFPGASFLYLYRPAGSGFERMAQRPLGNRSAWRIAWTPDGRAVHVIGFWLHDGETLAELPLPFQTRMLPPGLSLDSIRYAADGSYAAGASFGLKASGGVIRRWGGTGYQERAVPDPRHTDLVALKSGTVVVCALDGTLAAYDSALNPLWRHELDRPLFRDEIRQARVSADGRWVMLPYRQGERPATLAFNLEEPQFVPPEDVRGAAWRDPLSASPSARMAFARGGAMVNGNPLPRISPNERPISVAVHSTEPALVYGSTWQRVRKVRADGSQVWMRFVGAEPVSVNLIEDRDLVLVVLENGVVRLMRWSDGQALITYMVQPRSRRWLAIVPSGHYAASAGAEDDFGWIVNRDASRVADFFPMSRFRERFWLPRIVQAMFNERDLKRALDAARRDADGRTAAPKPALAAAVPPPADADETAQAVLPALPPVVDILSGYEITATIGLAKLRYRLSSADGAPVTAVRWRVNAASTSTQGAAGGAALGAEQELQVQVPHEDAEIQVFAESRHGVSAPATVRVRWAGAKAEDLRGTLHVLSVGVSDYDKAEYRLGLAAKDARDFVGIVRGQRNALYRDVVVREITDKAASREAVEDAFRWLKSQVKAGDTAMVFVAGHGINDDRGDYYFVPRDGDMERIASTGVSFQIIRSTLASLPGRTVLFLDTCHSGNVLGAAKRRVNHDNTGAVNELAAAENGIVVFASSTGQQQSLENPAWGNGAFTKALVEGFAGAADLKKRGRITYKQLDAFISDRVDELTNGRQSPVTPTLVGVPDFVLALLAR